LYGTEIDPRAGALAAFALTMKARERQRNLFGRKIKPNVFVLEPISFTSQELEVLMIPGGEHGEESTFWNLFANADVFGALIRPDGSLARRLVDHLDIDVKVDGDLFAQDVVERARKVLDYALTMARSYSVVVANPPYMGSNNMDGQLSSWLVRTYPLSKSDLMTAFMERAQALTTQQGFWGMINLPSWMFLSSFEGLRRALLRSVRLQSLLHLGRGVFGSDFGSVAFVACNAPLSPGHVGVYRRLFERHVDVRPLEKIRLLFLDSDYGTFHADQDSFLTLPKAPLAYWFPAALLKAFRSSPPLSATARAAVGLVTGDNATFGREWWEVSIGRIFFGAPDREIAKASGCRWFPYAKGGEFRRWAGNLEAVVNWENDGHAIQTTLTADGSRVRGHNFNLDRIFKPAIAWTVVTSGALSFRDVGPGHLFANAAGLCQGTDAEYLLALLNSDAAAQVLQGLNPTLNLLPGYLEAVPVPRDDAKEFAREIARRAVQISTLDWDSHERSWSFARLPVLDRGETLRHAVRALQEDGQAYTDELRNLERENNKHFAELFGLNVVEREGDTTSLSVNPDFAYAGLPAEGRQAAMTRDMVSEIVSYAVGCMFGRYSLDEPGLIVADQSASVREYFTKVPNPTFMPDADNVVPIVEGDWFEDDIVARFRAFLHAAFGEQHFEENLRFVTESLGVKDIRDYFVKSFYKDHWQRYKKRPIYWLFSSPKGSFNALIYMHRYTPSTVSTVLNEYLREFSAKLTSSLQQQERLAAGVGTPRQQAAAQKEADRLRKVLLELGAYEHDILYPLASRQIAIDLDDGVKVNYPKFGAALKKIPGLEASDE
ncbi:MAG: BREX-1 system adenine-specific DNA-methyltransferase PglX, partial [Rhodospirillaceae bacterium]